MNDKEVNDETFGLVWFGRFELKCDNDNDNDNEKNEEIF